MKNKVFVASRSFSSNSDLKKILEENFDDVSYNETGRILSQSELAESLHDSTHLIVAMEKVDASLIDKCSKLKVISKYGVGLDNIDLTCLEKNNVLLGWQGGVNRQSVAELTLSSMISLLHLVPKIQSDVRKGIWKQLPGSQLQGKRVGVIGCGYVGRRLIELLKPFECEIYAHDIKVDLDYAKNNHFRYVDLQTLLQEVEVVSLHLPLTHETRHIIDFREIDSMKSCSILLNYARGGLINESALLCALESGKLMGVALDVLENEPIINADLLNHNNLILTSHIGGSAKEAIFEMGKAAISGLINPKPIKYYLELK